MSRVLVPLAQGVEEMEAVIALDGLRRAGWEVIGAGLRPGVVKASRGVQLVPDADWDSLNVEDFDALVIPGGSEGVDNLKADQRVLAAVRSLFQKGKLLGAICAGPLVLQAAGVLDGRKATCHPAVADQLISADYVNEPDVVDGHLITSRGPGTSFLFVLAIIEKIAGAAKALEVRQGLEL